MAENPITTRFRSLDYEIPELKRYLARGMRVLDIGCGPGTITFDVARYVYPGSVIGVDPNPDRIEQAIDWTSEERKNANLEFNVNDCHDLPFQDCEFDIVYSHTVTQFLLDPVSHCENNTVL